MRMRVQICLLVILLGLGAAVPSHADEVVDGVAAIVGGDIILLSDVKAAEAMRRDRLNPKKHLEQGEVLNELINERLVKQEMDRLKIEVTPQELDQAMRMVLMQNHMTLDQMKAELAKDGITFDSYKQDLSDRVRFMKFMRQFIYSKIDVTDKDIEMHRRRYPQKSKEQTDAEIRDAILELKSQETFDAYVEGIRERTYVEIKKVS